MHGKDFSCASLRNYNILEEAPDFLVRRLSALLSPMPKPGSPFRKEVSVYVRAEERPIVPNTRKALMHLPPSLVEAARQAVVGGGCCSSRRRAGLSSRRFSLSGSAGALDCMPGLVQRFHEHPAASVQPPPPPHQYVICIALQPPIQDPSVMKKAAKPLWAEKELVLEAQGRGGGLKRPSLCHRILATLNL